MNDRGKKVLDGDVEKSMEESTIYQHTRQTNRKNKTLNNNNLNQRLRCCQDFHTLNSNYKQ